VVAGTALTAARGIAAASALVCALVFAAPATAAPPYAPVDAARLARAAADDGWLMYRRGYDAQGYAPFDQIGTGNVAKLREVFTFDTGLKQGHEAPPIVNGRWMFVTTPLGRIVALDATTGEVLWRYERPPVPISLRTVCCDVVNRGVALWGDRIYAGTLDGHLIALDARTGALVWDVTVAPYREGYAITSAPLIVEGKVITGVAGGENGIRGFIAAYDARSGSPLWRFDTVPSPGQPGSETWPANDAYVHGGGSTWLTGSYDLEQRTVFWGVGNPGPWLADMRPGANLYTNSLVALDVDTGKLKWAFQFTPHDSWDYDGVNESVAFDRTANGTTRKLLYHPDRNGHFVVLDRRTGTFVASRPFVRAEAVTGYAPNGTAQMNAAAYPGAKPGFACPSAVGGKNWWPSAYSPRTGLAYVPSVHLCMNVVRSASVEYRAGLPYMGVDFDIVAEPGAAGFGELQALDAATGERRWSVPSAAPWSDGVLATAGGLVFSAPADGTFRAFDAATGKELWSHPMASGVIGVPVSYRVAGKQYVAVFAGWGGGLALFGGPASELTRALPRVGRLYVFALPNQTSSERSPLTYAPAQLVAGAQAYRERCAACHGAGLEGSNGPPLRFAIADAGDAPRIADVFGAVAGRMPKDKPGSLDAATAVAVTAFLLERNGLAKRGLAATAAALRGSDERFVDRSVTAPRAVSSRRAPALRALDTRRGAPQGTSSDR
jgi:alcohol dehydrogenase (cytochrome c)